MSGFGLSGADPCSPSIVPAPDSAAEPAVTNDGWFPAIEPSALRAAARIRDAVTPERLRDAILAAIIWANLQLADWQADHVEAGGATLAAVPSVQVGGESRLAVLYRQAIAAWAKAALVERYRDTDLTGAGQRQVEELDASIGELRRDALHSIRDMLGRGRTSIELI